jgi:hypothetical protein
MIARPKKSAATTLHNSLCLLEPEELPWIVENSSLVASSFRHPVEMNTHKLVHKYKNVKWTKYEIRKLQLPPHGRHLNYHQNQDNLSHYPPWTLSQLSSKLGSIFSLSPMDAISLVSSPCSHFLLSGTITSSSSPSPTRESSVGAISTSKELGNSSSWCTW